MGINGDKLKKLNKKLKRKRMINTNYLIRTILRELGNKNYKKIDFKISLQTLKNYEDWWNRYKSMF